MFQGAKTPMADGEGFEPPGGVNLRRFSRPVLSTTQPPIQLGDCISSDGWACRTTSGGEPPGSDALDQACIHADAGLTKFNRGRGPSKGNICNRRDLVSRTRDTGMSISPVPGLGRAAGGLVPSHDSVRNTDPPEKSGRTRHVRNRLTSNRNIRRRCDRMNLAASRLAPLPQPMRSRQSRRR